MCWLGHGAGYGGGQAGGHGRSVLVMAGGRLVIAVGMVGSGQGRVAVTVGGGQVMLMVMAGIC